MRFRAVCRAGYTMVELLTVIAIISILAGIGLDAYFRYGRGNVLDEATSLVQVMLTAGRQAAITRGEDRRVAIDLRNNQLWLESKIDEAAKSWNGNARRLGEIVKMPQFADLADVNSVLGLITPDDTSVFPSSTGPAIFYVVFSPLGSVTEIMAGDRDSTDQTSFSLHIAVTNNDLPMPGGNKPYDYAMITSGQLRNIQGRVGPNATDQDAQDMLIRSRVHTITVLGNTGFVKTYAYGKNAPWNDNPPIGVYR